MNKFIRRCLIAAAVCLVFGICGCIAGCAMGAGKTAIAALESSDTLGKTDRLVRHVTDLVDATTDLSDNSDKFVEVAEKLAEKYGKEYEEDGDFKFSAEEKTKQTYSASEIQTIELQDVVGDVQISESKQQDTATVTIKAHNRIISAKAENKTLTIQDQGKTNKTKNSNVEIILELPQQKYQTITATMLAGDFETDMNLHAEKILLKSSAGDIDLEPTQGIEAALTVEALAGDIDLSGNYVGDIFGKMSAGDFDMEGRLEGNLTIDSAAGDIDIELNGIVTQYNYELRSSVGSVTMNDTDYDKGAGGSYLAENGAAHVIKLENSAGDIDLTVK